MAVLAVLTGGGAVAQGYGDTIDFMPRTPDYYYDDWWADQWGDTSNAALWLSYNATFRRFNTDRPLRIVGVAAAMSNLWFDVRNLQVLEVDDFQDTVEYLQLFDAYPDSFVMVAQIPWHVTDSHQYARVSTYPHINQEPWCCRMGEEEWVLPLYTYFFDNPVVVSDSFYLGCTHNFEDYRRPYSHEVYWITTVRTGIWTYATQFPYRCVNSPCQPMPLHKFRYDDSGLIRYKDDPAITMIFPIVECVAVETKNIHAEEIDSGRVRLRWDADSLNSDWEVAWGVSGTPPDSCVTMSCGSPEVVLDSLVAGVRYVAYLRAACRYIGQDYYSEWSDSIEIYIPVRHTVRAEANYAVRGSVEGGGVYEEGETAVLTARAWRPYSFLRWDDGEVTNPRRIVVTQDTAFTALFTDPEGMAAADSLGTMVQLLPNPAHNTVTVRTSAYSHDATLTIRDAAGRELLSMPVTSPSLTIPLRDYPSGTYMVTLTTKEGTATRQLVVE